MLIQKITAMERSIIRGPAICCTARIEDNSYKTVVILNFLMDLPRKQILNCQSLLTPILPKPKLQILVKL